MKNSVGKKKIALLCLVCLLVTMLSSAMAATPEVLQPRADTEFACASANLTSRKTVIYTLTTYEDKDVLAIESCWLMKKVDGEWTFVCGLPRPDQRGSNTFSFATEVDYSRYIGTGTYRVAGMFNADGHMITRYSNERTFK